MQSKSVYKVPNGKLLKIFLDYNEKSNLINKICITGDFFAYPEEAIDIIENKLKGEMLDRDELVDRIKSIVTEQGIKFIGLNVEGLAKGIMLCKHE